MNSSAKRFSLFVVALTLTGCVATVPVKVATKTAKAGVNATKATVKTTAKVGGALISGDTEKER